MSAVLTDKLVGIQLSVTGGPISPTAFCLGLRGSLGGEWGGPRESDFWPAPCGSPWRPGHASPLQVQNVGELGGRVGLRLGTLILGYLVAVLLCDLRQIFSLSGL